MQFSLIAAVISAGFLGFSTAVPTKTTSSVANPPFSGTGLPNPDFSAENPPFSGTGLPNPDYEAENPPPFSGTGLPNPDYQG